MLAEAVHQTKTGPFADFNLSDQEMYELFDIRISGKHRIFDEEVGWISIDKHPKNIPIEDFKPTWRGYNYSDYPALEIEEISSVGLHISDKQKGDFKLEIEYLKAIY